MLSIAASVHGAGGNVQSVWGGFHRTHVHSRLQVLTEEQRGNGKDGCLSDLKKRMEKAVDDDAVCVFVKMFDLTINNYLIFGRILR